MKPHDVIVATLKHENEQRVRDDLKKMLNKEPKTWKNVDIISTA